jgi:hypothetical protein
MASFADSELERIDILPDINLFAGEAKLAVRPLN